MKNPLPTKGAFSTAFLAAASVSSALCMSANSSLITTSAWQSMKPTLCLYLRLSAMLYLGNVPLPPCQLGPCLSQICHQTKPLCPHSNYYLPHSWRLTLACPLLHLNPRQLLTSLMLLIPLILPASLPVSFWPGTKSPCTRVLENLMSRKMSQIPYSGKFSRA